ncbi:tetratricopeptide repeat protein [Patescibacteria group bacterium]|nr:tetratricopeptide repeat protein [Patescibacteria group bacterium]
METNVQKQINWDFISRIVFCALVFILPIFVLPWGELPIVLSKSLLLYSGVSIGALFWFVGRLQKGEIKIPKSALLLSLLAIIVVWLASSLFSSNPSLSLIGRLFEIDTFFFFLFISIGLLLTSILFQSGKSGFLFYFLLFLSSAAVFLFQFFHIFFKVSLIPFKIFPSAASNLIGGWNDFGIFFGFILLASVALFELFRFKRYQKVLLFLLILASLFACMIVNLYTNWIILAFILLSLFVYLFYRSFYFSSLAQENQEKPGYYLVLFVFAATIFFLLAKGPMGDFTASINTSSIEVRPSWGATIDIAKETLKTNLLIGSGPNTFLYDWLKYKPMEVNGTIFWNARFISGVGLLPSLVATSGLLGGLALLAFIALFLLNGMKAVSYAQNDATHALLIASFFSSVYLWVFAIFYSVGFLVFALAFLNTGILLAMLARAGKIKVIELSFLRNPKIGFVSVLLIVLLIVGSISSLYMFLQKGLAAYYYGQGVRVFNSEGNIEKTESEFIKAARLDAQDEYFRALSELNLIKIQQIINNKNLTTEQAQEQFRNALASAIQNAQEATKLNPADPLNWMRLGIVYESVMPLKITGADGMAISSYAEAAKNSPLDPTPLLASARVGIQNSKLKEAREYIGLALDLKKDFAPALYLLSQIEATEGNLKEAIVKTEQTALLAPNDLGVLFQLGLLYYQADNWDGGRVAFERAILLNENYANARYFLGLIYDKLGQKEKAIEQFENIEKTNPENTEVKTILRNLVVGKDALDGISPPQKPPESREKPPIGEKTESELKKK